MLCQSCSDQSLFKFSQNRKQYTIDQLTSNLLKLLEESSTTNETSVLATKEKEILLKPQLLVGKRINHRFVESGELVWYKGTVLQMLDTREFEVMYDEEDDICCFSLLDDIKMEI